MNVIAKDFKVRMCSHVEEKIWGWTKACELECSGFGLVKKKGNIFTIYDAFLPDQKCSSGYTTIDTTSRAQFNEKMFKTGRNLKDMKVWWHSHVNMDCFWSGTDDNTARELCGVQDYTLSIVANKKDTYKCRLDINSPIGLTIDDIVIDFIGGHKIRNNDWKYQVEQKVKPLYEKRETYDYSRFSKWYDSRHKRTDDWRSSYVNYGGQIMTWDEYMKIKNNYMGETNGNNDGYPSDGNKSGQVSQPDWNYKDGLFGDY